MQVGNLLMGISQETVSLIEKVDEGKEDDDLEPVPPFEPPSDPGHVVAAGETGWVQQVNARGLLEALPGSGVAVLAVRPGVFVVEGTPLCTVWPPPPDPRRLDSEIRKRLEVGRERTMQQDISFGIRQLVDVGLRALSPGINDLTTAYEVVAHVGAVLRPLLLSDLPAKALRDGQGRRLLRPHELGHASYVERAFEQLRIPASKLPSMAIAMIGTMGMLREELEAGGLPDRARPLAQQAHLLLQGVEQADVLPQDVDRVRDALRGSRLDHETPASG